MPTLMGVIGETSQGAEKLTQQNSQWVEASSGSVQYYVLSDNTTQTRADILATEGLPALHSDVDGAMVIDRAAKEHSDVAHPVTGAEAILWKVTIKSDSSVNAEEAGEGEDPTDLTPKVRWWGEVEEELLERDAITGAAIQTVPGDPILLTTEFPIVVLEVKRFEAHPFNPNTILTYSGRTNENAFYGAPTGTALMMPIQADEAIIEGTTYSDVTYRVKFKIKEDPDNPGNLLADTWKARPLHHGLKYFKDFGEPAEVYRDASGQLATINLDANGLKLPKTQPPVFLAFNRFTKTDFAPLALGPFA